MHPDSSSRRLDALTKAEARVLECLGAAVVKEWNELPTLVQRALFWRAAATQDEDPVQLKILIARFLHDRKDASANFEVKA